MFYRLAFIIVTISFFSFNCKGADKKMDKDIKITPVKSNNIGSLKLNKTKELEYKKEGVIYKYNDGNGNLYIITKNKIIYDPVPMHLTSTGTFDNGKRKDKEITEASYSKVAGEYKKIFENKKIHIENRLKGSGFFKIQDFDNEKNNKNILISNCDEKREFEKLLKSLL